MLDLNYEPRELVETEGMPNDEWLKWRTSGIGGSDVAAIYGVSPWTTKRALYYSKIGLQKAEADNQFTLDFGHHVEPFVAAWFQNNFATFKPQLEAKLGVKIASFNIYKDTMMYQHPLYPYMNANLDYRFTLTTNDNKVIEGIFECKTSSYHIAPEKWAYNKVPYEYELQTRHYMAVMNLPYTIIACLWGNNKVDYAWEVVKRDLDIEEEMIAVEGNFWNNNVLKRVAPPLSKSQGQNELDAFKSYNIGELVKRGELKEIKSPDSDLLSAAQEYAKAQQQKKALETQIEKIEELQASLKTKILEKMAGESKVVIGEHKANATSYLVKNVQTKKTTIDSKRLKLEQPDIAKEYSKESVSERFTLKEYLG